LSGSSPLTCLAWEALPVAYDTASIVLGIMWPHKPHHYVKVGIPSGDTHTHTHIACSGLSEYCRELLMTTSKVGNDVIQRRLLEQNPQYKQKSRKLCTYKLWK
jgi:hypothetical protein